MSGPDLAAARQLVHAALDQALAAAVWPHPSTVDSVPPAGLVIVGLADLLPGPHTSCGWSCQVPVVIVGPDPSTDPMAAYAALDQLTGQAVAALAAAGMPPQDTQAATLGERYPSRTLTVETMT